MRRIYICSESLVYNYGISWKCAWATWLVSRGMCQTKEALLMYLVSTCNRDRMHHTLRPVDILAATGTRIPIFPTWHIVVKLVDDNYFLYMHRAVTSGHLNHSLTGTSWTSIDVMTWISNCIFTGGLDVIHHPTAGSLNRFQVRHQQLIAFHWQT